MTARRGFALSASFEDHVVAARYASTKALAAAMGVAPSTVSRVRAGEMGAGRQFIRGLRRAFPDTPLADLVDLT